MRAKTTLKSIVTITALVLGSLTGCSNGLKLSIERENLVQSNQLPSSYRSVHLIDSKTGNNYTIMNNPGGIDVFTGKSMYDSVFDKVIISDKTGERAYTREELEKNDKSSLEALDAAYLAYR
ncbi:hypothetical protein J4405_01515 [Candidatus Woesearchaeota archaeon]|nr:hypothetical protein [Candidatus Woesearchaeota archaeon]